MECASDVLSGVNGTFHEKNFAQNHIGLRQCFCIVRTTASRWKHSPRFSLRILIRREDSVLEDETDSARREVSAARTEQY